jgi:hypothetical protein
MRILNRGESVVVEGERLIAGQPECGCAIVTSVVRPTDVGSVGATTYGVTVSAGSLQTGFGDFELLPGMYFCFTGPGRINSDSAIAIERRGFVGLNMVGGPVEKSGRLAYIDGCTDTLLIGPPVLGDPCFNLLHFPKHIDQTMHTHPSLRCGITISGKGVARFPDGEVPLEPGMCWFLETSGHHAFYTTDSELLVTAWHPDSDTGPNRDDHPMLNRTIVDGVSAKHIPSILTPEAIAQ